MEVKAQLKNARMAPRKVRLLREAVLGLTIGEARAQLRWQPGKAAELILGVLNSAVANATHNFDLPENNLKVTRLEVNQGVVFKRFQPVSRGRANPYLKRTAHIVVGVDEITASARRPGKGRTSEIETVSVEDFAKQAEVPAADVDVTDEAAPARPEPSVDKKLTAFQKKKMQQQGGDRSKTHRRKSI